MVKIKRWVLKTDAVALEVNKGPGDTIEGREYWTRDEVRLCKGAEVKQLEHKYDDLCQVNADLSKRDVDQRMRIEELETEGNRLRAEIADLNKRVKQQ